MRPVREERANTPIIQVFPFGSDRECMGSVVRHSDGTYRVYVKGASETLLDKCTQVIAEISGPIKVLR
jgi:Ca2+-transporting ATPase